MAAEDVDMVPDTCYEEDHADLPDSAGTPSSSNFEEPHSHKSPERSGVLQNSHLESPENTDLARAIGSGTSFSVCSLLAVFPSVLWVESKHTCFKSIFQGV